MLATAAATPGLWDWSLDPSLVLVVALAVFYLLGARRTVTLFVYVHRWLVPSSPGSARGSRLASLH